MIAPFAYFMIEIWNVLFCFVDDDDDTQDAFKNYKDRRRNAHTAAEQKRRDAIKVCTHITPHHSTSSLASNSPTHPLQNYSSCV